MTICPAHLELYDSLAIHLEANGNDHLKIIVILTVADLPSSLCLNYSEFPNSCLLCQLSVRINLFDMFIDGGESNIIQCRRHILSQPDILILMEMFDLFRRMIENASRSANRKDEDLHDIIVMAFIQAISKFPIHKP